MRGRPIGASEYDPVVLTGDTAIPTLPTGMFPVLLLVVDTFP